MTAVGTVAALWTYPIKGLAAREHAVIAVERDGFAGDRTSALIVQTKDHARFGKPYRGKEQRLLHTVADAAGARALARDARLEIEPVDGGRFYDAADVSLIFDTWLDDVETLAGVRAEPLRYRPNIYAHAAPQFFARERELVGAVLELGTVRLRVDAAIGRCVTPSYDVTTGEADPRIMRAVAQHRANTVGVYCSVLATGYLRPGVAITRA